MSQILGRNLFTRFLFPVPQFVNLGKEQATGVHDVPAAITIGAGVNDLPHPAFRMIHLTGR
jgi:hypothetical protein